MYVESLRRGEADNEVRDFTLYRWWDSSGHLLYVGKSVSVFARIAQHRRGSAFYSAAATMTMEHYPSAGELAVAELSAIMSDNPLYNVIGGRHDPSKPSPQLKVSTADETSGYWKPIDYDDVRFGDLIRCQEKNGVLIEGQGMVDNWEETDDDGHFWVLYDADSEELILYESESRFCDIFRWESPDPDDAALTGARDAAMRAIAGI